MSSPKPTVTVERLACRIVLASGAEERFRTVDLLTRLATDEVPARVAARLEGLLGDDDGVYRVRRLHLSLVMDLRVMTRAELAARWANALAGTIARELARPGSPEVLRFDGAADYLTSFLRDLLDGRAWARWCYEDLRPLQRLDAGQVALHLLATSPTTALPVLLNLAASGHDIRLLQRWDAADVDRLWDALGLAPPSAPVPAGALDATLLRRLAGSLARGIRFGWEDRSAIARNRLAAWLALADRHPALARDPAAVTVLARLVDLVLLVRAEPELAPLLAMRSPLYPSLVGRIARGPLADSLAWLGPTAGTPELARLVEAAGFVPPSLSSPVGSVGLVLPALDESDCWEPWRQEHGEEGARHCILAVLLKALGRRRAVFALSDPLLAALAGLAAPPVADARLPREEDRGPPGWASAEEPDRLAADAAHLQLGAIGYPWLTPSLDAALSLAASQVLRRTAMRFPGFTGAAPTTLAAVFLAHPATLVQEEPWRLQLSGGPAAALLRMADLPAELSVPWLERPLRFETVP